MEQIKLPQLLELLWEDYINTNPPAKRIYDLFSARGEKIINDHIAFRTFDHPQIGVDVLGAHFVKLGYEEKGEYHFEKKKLYAKHFEHPDSKMPLVFISQLLMKEFDEETQRIINGLIQQMPKDVTSKSSFLYSGKHWDVSYSEYQTLKNVSEYAAWMAAYGFRVNHFTVSINHLKQFDGIRAVNQFLKESGYQLNDSGGEVKGTQEDLLEQSSTIAYNKEVSFSDGKQVIPACYYEFAMRYQNDDGQLFRGFIAGSADKIFESTDKGQDFKLNKLKDEH